ncbi:MAG: porin [Deltaproteobacteria bacterium]|nr:porin [Deltaproteobacteria bacterium]
MLSIARIARIVSGVVAMICIAAPALAADRDEELRILREDNERMREDLRDQAERIDALEGKPEAEPIAHVGASLLEVVVAGVPIRLTGFIKGDMLWNDARVDSTSAPRFADARRTGGDDQFTATVQHTRLGLVFGRVPIGSGTIGGLIELDFFNLSDSGDNNFNNNQLRTRLLYMDLEFGNWSIIAGQAWDLVSPLNPDSLNTNGNRWFGGNAGFRRPQLQVARKIVWAKDSPLTLKGSINANIGATTSVSGKTFDSGRRSGMPVFEAAIEQSLPGCGAGPIRFGFAGFYGEEDLKGVDNGIKQWMYGAYVVVPIVDWLTLTGEIQTGKNTDALLTGGGINTTTGNGIKSTSGWIQATLTPIDDFTFNVLYGLDDRRNSNLAAGAAKKNQVVSANVKYQIFDPLVIGLEYQNFNTDYKADRDATAHMGWVSMIFSF